MKIPVSRVRDRTTTFIDNGCLVLVAVHAIGTHSRLKLARPTAIIKNALALGGGICHLVRISPKTLHITF